MFFGQFSLFLAVLPGKDSPLPPQLDMYKLYTQCTKPIYNPLIFTSTGNLLQQSPVITDD